MPKEDKAWEKLYEKYRPKPKKVKKPISKKKISTIVGSVLACLSVLFIFLYFNYFALPVYNNVNSAMASMIESDVGAKYSLSRLPTGHCYWIRPSYDDGKHLLEVREYDSDENCLGSLINTTVFELDGPLDIAGDTDCVCQGSRYVLDKISENGRIAFEVEKR